MLSNRRFLWRMAQILAVGFAIELIIVAIGAIGFHFLEGLAWVDAALNTVMVITGNGPRFAPLTIGSKLFQMIFTLFGVMTFVLIASVVFAHVFHRVLHHFHMEPAEQPEAPPQQPSNEA